MLKNRMVQVIEKDTLLNEENLSDIEDGLDKIGESRDKIDVLIGDTKNAIIQNSIHLLIQRIMNEDKEGVIEMLNNNRDVIHIFNFTEKLDDLINEYGKYDRLYDQDYPEIKKIKETFVLKEKELLPLLTEIVNERK
tara:strand:- start:407 stop:817 length:411 start_codon:yes stop_codon:yes gene_type:complete